MMMSDRAQIREADGPALPPAVHGRRGDVQVDADVGLERRLVERDLEAALGLAQVDEALAVLGVVADEALAGPELRDRLAEERAELAPRQLPVERVRADERDLARVDPLGLDDREDRGERRRARVGARERQPGHAAVVERDED